MTNSVLDALIPITYRQSDLAYRLGLLREFLEFVFFTQQTAQVGSEAVSGFSSVGPHDANDLAFLRSLPPELYASFTSSTFYDALDRALSDAKALSTVRLTVAVLLPSEEVEVMGKWMREVVGDRTLFELSINPEIGAGCQLLWQNALHDYSLEQRLREHEQELYQRIPALFSDGVAA